MGSQIVVSELTEGEIAAVLERYEVLIEAMRASNNTLLLKMGLREDVSVDAMKVMNDWSVFNNHLTSGHSVEVARLLGHVH